MMPRLLDLFCGAGGAAKGYQRAGFYVVGVDHKPQPRYCGEEFIQADALEYVRVHGREFDAIHASPPCQLFSNGRNYMGRKSQGPGGYLDLLTPVLAELRDHTQPWVVENVLGARPKFYRHIMVCGTTLGLRVQRHRLFESNVVLFEPGPCCHRPNDVSVRRKQSEYLLMYRDVTTKNGIPVRRPSFCSIKEARLAMGIDWMVSSELGEALPPAYTYFVGCQLMVALGHEPSVWPPKDMLVPLVSASTSEVVPTAMRSEHR